MKRLAIVMGVADDLVLAILASFARAGCETCLLQPASAAGDASLADHVFSVDLADRKAIAAAFDRLPRIDVVVCTNGETDGHAFPDVTEAELQRGFDDVVRAAFLVSQEAVRRMKDGGYVVHVSSRDFLGAWHRVSGSASHAALVAMTRAMAIDLVRRGIYVNAVAPGIVEGRLPADEAERKASLAMIPVNRPAGIQEIVRAVEFFASEENTFITGQTLVIDGGRTLGSGMGV